MPYNQLVRISDSYTLQFARINGEINLPSQRLKEISEEAVGGVAFKKTSYKAEAQVMTAEAYAVDDLDLAGWRIDLEQTTGTQCRFYDARGLYIHGVVITDIRVVKTRLVEFQVFEGTYYVRPWKITCQIVMKYPYAYY